MSWDASWPPRKSGVPPFEFCREVGRGGTWGARPGGGGGGGGARPSAPFDSMTLLCLFKKTIVMNGEGRPGAPSWPSWPCSCSAVSHATALRRCAKASWSRPSRASDVPGPRAQARGIWSETLARRTGKPEHVCQPDVLASESQNTHLGSLSLSLSLSP